MDLESAQMRARRFVEERDWAKFHTPKNLAMALVSEVGELVEILQWRSEEESKELIYTSDFQKLCEELADVQIYILRLADVLGVDLERAVQEKQLLNERRYPVEESAKQVAKYSRTAAGLNSQSDSERHSGGSVSMETSPKPGAGRTERLLEGRLRLRPYQTEDASHVVDLVAAALERLYPSAQDWLIRKLREVDLKLALCTIAELDDRVVGLSIETIKKPARRKLSTVWVDEPVRGLGIGSRLLAAHAAAWRSEGVQEVYATASVEVMNAVTPLLVPVGFQFRALELDRYGLGRHELVLEWTPHSAAASTDPGWIKDELVRINDKCGGPGGSS
jgi:dCTP diphosphatase